MKLKMSLEEQIVYCLKTHFGITEPEQGWHVVTGQLIHIIEQEKDHGSTR